MTKKIIFVIKSNIAPIVTRCFTKDRTTNEFSVDVSNEDWAKQFDSISKAMLYYGIRGIPAFIVPINDKHSTGYWISEDELKKCKFESNGIEV